MCWNIEIDAIYGSFRSFLIKIQMLKGIKNQIIKMRVISKCEYIKLDRDKSTFKSHRDFNSEKEISFKHF